MKSKAKPTKGSARTKRFDVGGTVGALAGLGTLAYLLSRKKKDATGAESGGMSKDPNAPSVMDRLKNKADTTSDTTSDNKPFVRPPPGVIFEEDRAKEKDRMDSAVETHRRITSGGGGGNAPVVKKKPVIKNVVKKDDDKKAGADKAPAYTGQGMAGSDKGAPRVPALKGGESKVEGEGTLKPYPANLPAVKEAERRKLLQRRVTTAGDPNKKEPTSAGFKRIQSAVQGTLDNAGKSTVRSDKEKMAAGAREVERRRQEAKAAKQGYGIKKGGMVKKYANGGSVMASKMGSVKTAKPSMRSASSRADGIAQRGKTRA